MANQAARTVLGDDIGDLSPFGGSATAVLREGLEPHDAREAIVQYIVDGTEFSPKSRAIIKERAASRQLSFVAAPRLIIAALLSLPDAATDRGAALFGLQSPLSLRQLVSLNSAYFRHYNSQDKASVDDLLLCGQRWGWGSDELIVGLVNGEYRLGVAALPRLSQFITKHANSLLELAASVGASTNAATPRAGLWASLAGGSAEVLQLFASELMADATSDIEQTRLLSLRLANALPHATAIQELLPLARDTSTAVRKRATSLLLSVLAQRATPPPELFDWVEERIAQESSDQVLTVLNQIGSMVDHHRSTNVVLPEVVFENVKVSPREWDRRNDNPHGEVPQQDLPAEEAGRYLSGPSQLDPREARGIHYVVTTAAEALGLNDRLAPANQALQLLRSARLGAVRNWWAEIADDRVAANPLFLSAVARSADIPSSAVIRAVGQLWCHEPGRWTSERLTPWFDAHAIEIIPIIQDADRFRSERQPLLELVLGVEVLPAIIRDALIRAALSGPKADRQRISQRLRVTYAADIATFLTKSQAERVNAAEWLAAHPAQAGTQELLHAARTEKNDIAKSAMLMALEARGVDLEEFLSPEVLRTTATKAMSKKSSRSKAIEWLDVDSLPALHWASGDPVENAVTAWMLHSAAKAKSAAPSPIVRRQFSNMEPTGVHAFGEALLRAWISQDLRRVSQDEALRNAQRQAASLHSRAKRFPQAPSDYSGMTEEQITNVLLPRYAQAFLGSARTSQGVLALVAASESPAAADLAFSYIRKHRTKRSSQSKALIEMLTWTSDPSAVQTVMAMANRFHPKSLQQEAGRQVELLAQHHGWSVDDLADRSVPDGGFGRDGQQSFDFGTRTFTARLDDDLEVELVDDATGKSVRSLPRGRADEDRDRIKALKALLKEAKTDAAAARDFQPHRLRRAMATQRIWSPEDFRRFVLEQPMMIRLASRLLWSTTGDDEVVFRPLSDGTILGMDDDELDLGGRSVRLVHGTLLSDAVERIAADHLQDYEVDALFAQLHRTDVHLDQDQRALTAVAGVKLSANTLASRARARGWQVIDTFQTGKSVGVSVRFVDLDIEVVLAVENGLALGGYDYTDYDCTLSNLFVVDLGPQQPNESAAVELGTLPPVLLSEIVHDAKIIASSGD